MNELLNAITQSAQSIKALSFHPLTQSSLEEKMLYLNVLSLMSDNDRASSRFLLILMDAVKLDSSIQQSLIESSANPDKDTIVEFIERFRHSTLSIPFLSDCLMLSACEDELEEKQIQIINKLAMELQIFGKERDAVYKNFELVKGGYFEDVDKKVISEHVFSYYRVPEAESVSIKKTYNNVYIESILNQDKLIKLKSYLSKLTGNRYGLNKTASFIWMIRDEVVLSSLNDLLINNVLFYKNGQVIDKNNNIILKLTDFGLTFNSHKKQVVSEGGKLKYLNTKTLFSEYIIRYVLHDCRDFSEINDLFGCVNLQIMAINKLYGRYQIPRLGNDFSSSRIIAVDKDKFIVTNGTNSISGQEVQQLTDLPKLLSKVNLQLEEIR